MADVISIGELLVEFVSSADNVDLINSPGFVKAPGGAPANVAVALTRLGTPAGFIGKVGDDPFGQLLGLFSLRLGHAHRAAGRRRPA